jgi:long-chain acyl-CoA synthetase
MHMVNTDIGAHALRGGQSVALRSAGQSLTYAELVSETERVAGRLTALGVTKGAPVAVLCENCIDVLLLYYAVGKMGGTFIPVNPSLTAPEVAYILEHSEVAVLLHDEKMAPIARAAHEQCSKVKLIHLQEFQELEPAALSGNAAPAQENFLIVYTSGSTGKPKAVIFDQEAEVAGNQSLIEMWGMNASDVTVVALPLGFLYGLSTAAATALQAGGEVVVMRRFHPSEVLEAFVRHRATVFQGVPTMFAMMLEYAEQNDVSFDLSSMRLLISAGAPLSRELRSRFERKFKKRIDDYYAMTEVRPIFGRYSTDMAPVPETAIGKLAPGALISIVDATGNEVPEGQVGELLVRAPSTTRGYLKNEALSKELFVNGMLRTGDLGYRDASGYYYLTGRIKDIIIRGGANIAPAEVEDVLATHPYVQSVAVIGVPDEKFGQLVAAYVVVREGKVDDEELRSFCRERLADFKVPSYFVRSSELPLGITGKVDKASLLRYWMEGRR